MILDRTCPQKFTSVIVAMMTPRLRHECMTAQATISRLAAPTPFAESAAAAQ